MAGDWIKVEAATPDKPEVWVIADALGIDPDAVFGKLMRVWIWFDQQSEDGNAPSVSKLLLNRLVGVSDFCDHMIKAGWMTDDGQTIQLPNFDRHNGKTAKNRALTAKRVAKHKGKGNDDSVTKVTEDALPREEKRREDINTTSPAKADDMPDCPYQKIVDSYHKHCPMMTQVKKLTEPRKKALKARWREDKKHQTIEFWDRYFDYASQSDFLAGNAKEWTADFDFLIRQSKFVSVIEGKYHREGAA